jgi:hypothetical protein
MAYSLIADVSTTPDKVMAALQNTAAYWQESITPEPLRRKHVLSVELSGNAGRFELFGAYSRRQPIDHVAITGHLVSTPTGTQVRARVGLRGGKQLLIGPVAMCAMCVVAIFAWDRTSVLVFGGIALFWGLILFFVDRAIAPRQHEVADHLVERFQLAMQTLGADTVVDHHRRL